MLFTMSPTLSSRRNGQKLQCPALDLTSPPKRGTMTTTGLKPLEMKMRKAFVSGKWVYFKNNFERSAEGMYSDEWKENRHMEIL